MFERALQLKKIQEIRERREHGCADCRVLLAEIDALNAILIDWENDAREREANNKPELPLRQMTQEERDAMQRALERSMTVIDEGYEDDGGCDDAKTR
jgi:hypothetical protein